MVWFGFFEGERERGREETEEGGALCVISRKQADGVCYQLLKRAMRVMNLGELFWL